MTNTIGNGLDSTTNFLRRLGWSIAAIIMLLPLVGMQFSEEVNWELGDFVFAAAMLGSVGIALELVVRTTADWSYRIGAIVALGAAFVTVWVNLAVGFVGSEDNPLNGLFFLVLPVAALGAAIARFKPTGMAWAMAATALAQAIVAIFIIAQAQSAEAWIFSLFFIAPWLAAATLFRNASSG